MRLGLSISLLTLAFATSAEALERDYVVCDNGLRCVVAPCPSTNAFDLKRRRLEKGVWVDIQDLSPPEVREVVRYDGLYNGTVVIRGELVDRNVDVMRRKRVLPVIEATKIVRQSTPRERRICRGLEQPRKKKKG